MVLVQPQLLQEEQEIHLQYPHLKEIQEDQVQLQEIVLELEVVEQELLALQYQVEITEEQEEQEQLLQFQDHQ